ncbi:MAG: ABC transporter ATP-binding protein, partial [Candidatus Hecatellaceae archaeon]
FNLINELTVLENVMLPALICGVSFEEAEREALTLLKAVGLADKTSHSAAKLSGGEMQRVSIARALINKPALVLADEPTGNLDSQTSAEIIKLMKELNRRNRQTFILVTHDPTVAEAATKIIKILDGRVIEEKTV